MEDKYKQSFCPQCKAALHTLASDRQLTSSPPHIHYKCDSCDFVGYVLKEFANPRPLKRLKFSQEINVTNSQWLDTLRSLID